MLLCSQLAWYPINLQRVFLLPKKQLNILLFLMRFFHMGIVSQAGLLVALVSQPLHYPQLEKSHFFIPKKGLRTMNKKVNVTQESDNQFCANCGVIGLEDLILREDDMCHCLECDHAVVAWAVLSPHQKEFVEVPVISTTKLAFTRKLADVFLELADMPAKDMRSNLRKLAIVLNTMSDNGVTK